ncbi:MAG: class B sortase [Eubacterium sp.]|nr:class B sortase [Eubacterium sp.]MCM1303067.1 class B sortase [Butyrivibrio sp.]MCM1343388.1 class B sortase [Muribaculaceae bacterium]MCM1410557.1 class B sortase [Lachnospiraceae bacterium]
MSNIPEHENGNKKKLIYLVLAVLFALAAVAALGYLVYHNGQVRKQQEEYEALLGSMAAAQTPAPMPTSVPLPSADTAGDQDAAAPGRETQDGEALADASSFEIPEKGIDFDVLHETNEDIYAWITIPDTNVDYPVLQHPTELDYYLDYNLDGSKGYPGCIYSQFLNAKDFSDFNTVLYGHNMKAGTMFANLHYYEDPVFFEEHPYVYIYTEEGPLVYQVFAAYAFSNVHLLMGFDLSQESLRELYIDNIFSLEGMNDNFNRDVEVTADSRILTLSTCITNQADKRYLVAAVLVADGRDQGSVAAADQH